MSERVRVCAPDELELGKPRAVEVAGERICVVRCAAGVYAIDDTCSHEDYSLAEGEVDTEECAIECWAHGSVFSLRTGEPENLPATRPVRTYPVELDAEGVHVVVRP